MTKIMRTLQDVSDELSRETLSSHSVLSNDYTSASDDMNNLVDDIDERLSDEDLPDSAAKTKKVKKNGEK